MRSPLPGYSGGIDTSSKHDGSSPEAVLRPGVPGHWLRRGALAGAAVAVLALGLCARAGLPGVFGDAAGGILYAVLIYLLLAFILPRSRRLWVTGGVVVVCVLIELFQLTPYPAHWAGLWPPLRLVLGTTFNPWDLPAYAAGAAAACLGDAGLSRIGRLSRMARPGKLRS